MVLCIISVVFKIVSVESYFHEEPTTTNVILGWQGYKIGVRTKAC